MPDGAAITNVSVATSFQWNDKASGEKKEETEWHRIVFRGKLAEIAGEYLKKGRTVYIEGRLRTDSWEDKNTHEKKYRTEIVVNDLVLLGGGQRGEGDDHGGGGKSRAASANNMDQRTPAEDFAQSAEITDEDIPF